MRAHMLAEAMEVEEKLQEIVDTHYRAEVRILYLRMMEVMDYVSGLTILRCFVVITFLAFTIEIVRRGESLVGSGLLAIVLLILDQLAVTLYFYPRMYELVMQLRLEFRENESWLWMLREVERINPDLRIFAQHIRKSTFP